MFVAGAIELDWIGHDNCLSCWRTWIAKQTRCWIEGSHNMLFQHVNFVGSSADAQGTMGATTKFIVRDRCEFGVDSRFWLRDAADVVPVAAMR